MTAIILAGGFGTRLQSVVKDVPKPMAIVNKKPFLEYILKYLEDYNITNIILSVGYKQEVIKDYFGNNYGDTKISYSCEETPLGTGGAINQALKLVPNEDKDVLVLNGDTFFEIDFNKLKDFKSSVDFDIILSVKQMRDFDRYGAVLIEDNIIKAFDEKKYYKKAHINCGLYIIKKSLFDKVKLNTNFSFEEFIEDNLNILHPLAYISNNSYFIDIGIPDDYKKAQVDFKELF